MNDDAPAPRPEGVCIRGDGYTAEAGWFGPEDRPRFGWLYRPGTPAPNGVGVVIVPPFGSEDMRAHRTLRHLAQDLSKAGFVSLRFDPDGCGDSAGDDTEPARLQAWIDSVGDACDLARRSGAIQLMVIGVRLGAALAALAAARRSDIAAIVTFNPVVQGRKYLRELRAFSQSMALPEPPASMNWSEAGQETGGFLFSQQTRDDIQALDLTTLPVAPASRVLLLERDDLPVSHRWAEHLRALGIEPSEQRIPGYVKMMDHPHANVVAQVFINACVEYAAGLRVQHEATSERPITGVLRSAVTLHMGNATIIEEAVCIDGQLVGILSRPAHGAAPEAVLMLNVGANRHVGSNRTDVPLARELAFAGRQALRADLSGIGDSPARKGSAENIVYSLHAMTDIALMVQALRARGARRITVGGMCSGAYHALYAAIAGLDVQEVYAVNCSAFGSKVEFDPENTNLFGAISHYQGAMKSSRSWRKLLTGKVAVHSIARVVGWRAKALARKYWHELAFRIHLPLRDNLGAHLVKMSRHGIRVHFLYADNEPGLMMLKAEAGSVIPRLCKTESLVIRRFAGVDHTFTQRWAQAQLGKALLTILR
jgi:alpha-beta hydrolase superfamily lysophospholipase